VTRISEHSDEFRILSPLEVWEEHSLLIPTAAKPRALLTILFLHLNQHTGVEPLLLNRRPGDVPKLTPGLSTWPERVAEL
jgi:hypothetical protein